jgi:hypothetical protein
MTNTQIKMRTTSSSEVFLRLVLIPQINGFGFSDYLEHSGKFSQYTNHSILGVAA